MFFTTTQLTVMFLLTCELRYDQNGWNESILEETYFGDLKNLKTILPQAFKMPEIFVMYLQLMYLQSS